MNTVFFIYIAYLYRNIWNSNVILYIFLVPSQKNLTISYETLIFILIPINLKWICVQKENIADCMIIFLPNQYYTMMQGEKAPRKDAL